MDVIGGKLKTSFLTDVDQQIRDGLDISKRIYADLGVLYEL